MFGRHRRIVLGKHSGMASVAGALQELGLAADKHQTRLVLVHIQERSMQAKRAVSTEELLEFYAQVSGAA
jgi:homocitrate synthase NifV